jgi:hypothetical protein
MAAKPDIVERAEGSFQLAQMLCRQLCLHEGTTEIVLGEQRQLRGGFHNYR